mmetsp:Transcript_10827/g.16122  ORF Transcript_10827/g.16122 Transcript_10827/m.16122 type:complete len:549 (+) Transcript_10827:171-1817(+)|eukprot:CAMPEP_0196811598 /NCGR_PEP_ID=MMETSP1362-20130617/18946_1 /TAXON_ID=163516 /ORGANISM="Leptocylindrus danicus, Strain CCMP1856" /LENGTH=548 /DNA_ID=CAMNT_0042186941 /DNA_START=142 /DNA_END=1788 /DNA_ORIENTATION=+
MVRLSHAATALALTSVSAFTLPKHTKKAASASPLFFSSSYLDSLGDRNQYTSSYEPVNGEAASSYGNVAVMEPPPVVMEEEPVNERIAALAPEEPQQMMAVQEEPAAPVVDAYNAPRKEVPPATPPAPPAAKQSSVASPDRREALYFGLGATSFFLVPQEIVSFVKNKVNGAAPQAIPPGQIPATIGPLGMQPPPAANTMVPPPIVPVPPVVQQQQQEEEQYIPTLEEQMQMMEQSRVESTQQAPPVVEQQAPPAPVVEEAPPAPVVEQQPMLMSNGYAPLTPACADAIAKNFPNAIPIHDFNAELYGMLQARGYTQQNTLLATSICPDEINSGFVLDMLHTWELPKQFTLGGLAGVPFVGTSGMDAFLHHVPNANNQLGKVVIVFGPHIGITEDGQVGKIARENQGGASTACGAAIGAYKAIMKAQAEQAKNQMGSLSAANSIDAQEEYIIAQLDDKLRKFPPPPEGQGDPIAHVTRLMYVIVKEFMLKTMNTLEDAGTVWNEASEIALVGGILINTAEGKSDYFQPLMFECRKGQVEDLLGDRSFF